MKKTIITLASVAALTVTANAQNLLTNGNINHTLANGSTTFTGNTTALPGWTLAGSSSKAYHGYCYTNTAGNNTYVIGGVNPANQDANRRLVYQDVNVNIGTTYSYAINGVNYGAQDSRLFIENISAIGGTITTEINELSLDAQTVNSSVIQSLTGTFTATSSTIRIGYDISGYEANANASRDFISFDTRSASLTVVPEPSSTALLGLGGLALLLRRKK